MQQFKQPPRPWTNMRATAPEFRFSPAHNSDFSNTFPINLINNNKIKVNYDFISAAADVNDEKNTSNCIRFGKNLRNIPIQKIDDNDIPDLIDDNEYEYPSGIIREREIYPKNIIFPKIQINPIPVPVIVSPITNIYPSIREVPIYDANFVNPDIRMVDKINPVNVANSIANTRSQNYIFGHVSNAPEITTSENLFIANYMKQHNGSEIQKALMACKKEYSDSLVKLTNDIKHEDGVKSHTITVINNISENPITHTPDGHVETDISISSEKFNEIFADVPLVKLTNESCCHNGMMIVEGLNVDHNEFRYDKSCGPDGIYFCRLDDMINWLDYSHSPMFYIWDVAVPTGARAVMYRNKLKADRLIFSNKRKISDHMTSKLMKMIQDDENINVIFDIIDRISVFNTARPDAQSMENIYIAMLKRDFNLFTRIPEDSKSYNIMMFMAINDPDGYEKIKGEWISHEIIMECIKKNARVFAQIPVKQISQEMSDYFFSRNAKNYDADIDVINDADDRSFFQRSGPYLEETQKPDSYDVISQKKGSILGDVDFRLKTYNLCTAAVNICGKALEYVPLALVDQAMCDDAVTDSMDVYAFVPEKFRTVALKEAMVKAHHNSIKLLSPEEITHNMILSIITNSEADSFLSFDMFDFKSKHIVELFTLHIKEYIDTCSYVHKYIPDILFTDEMALYVISKDLSAIEIFEHRSIKFIVEAVKIGVKFHIIPSHVVNQDMLNELVTSRSSLIKELPLRFLSDDLYIICMREHNMQLSDVPEEFRTSKLAKIALDIYPFESEIHIDQIENGKNQALGVIPSVDPTLPLIGSIGFDSKEITLADIVDIYLV